MVDVSSTPAAAQQSELEKQDGMFLNHFPLN